MKKVVLIAALIMATGLAQASVSVINSVCISVSASASNQSRTVTLTGKKSTSSVHARKTKKAEAYMDDSGNVYVYYQGDRYLATHLGGNEYGFSANDGYYFTFNF